MGLAPLMVQKVFETIITVSKEGVTILLIEQNAKLALEVSRRGYVMESGEITLEGDAEVAAARSQGARGVSRRDGVTPAAGREPRSSPARPRARLVRRGDPPVEARRRSRSRSWPRS